MRFFRPIIFWIWCNIVRISEGPMKTLGARIQKDNKNKGTCLLFGLMSFAIEKQSCWDAIKNGNSSIGYVPYVELVHLGKGSPQVCVHHPNSLGFSRMCAGGYSWSENHGAVSLDGHDVIFRSARLLGNPYCPGFPTGNASPGQKGVPFCPGSGNRDKRCCQRPRGCRTLLSRLVLPTGIKCPFVFLFSFSQFFFYFNYTFAFQLNLCIGIQCVWSPLIYIYIYIVTYIIFVPDSFHI